MNAVTCLRCFTTSNVVPPASCPNCGSELKAEPAPVNKSASAFDGLEVPLAERLNEIVQSAYEAEQRCYDLFIDPKGGARRWGNAQFVELWSYVKGEGGYDNLKHVHQGKFKAIGEDGTEFIVHKYADVDMSHFRSTGPTLGMTEFIAEGPHGPDGPGIRLCQKAPGEFVIQDTEWTLKSSDPLAQQCYEKPKRVQKEATGEVETVLNVADTVVSLLSQ